jgi:hypothetical protein
VSPEALSFLRHAVSQPPAALKAVVLPDRAGRELERLHGVLLARHLEREPRSARVLRAMSPLLSAPPPGEDAPFSGLSVEPPRSRTRIPDLVEP